MLLEPTLTTLGNFLVRSNSSVASASFTVEGYAMTLSAFAWNIVRTYTLTPGRRYSFGCRYRLGSPGWRVNNSAAAGKLQGGELCEDCVEGALERGLAG